MLEIIRARKAISSDPISGPQICCSCGRQCDGTPLKNALSNNFTDISGLAVNGGTFLCDSCIGLMADKDVRFKPVLFVNGLKRVLNKTEVLDVICNPPQTDFVLSVPYSHKKYHIFYAGLSNTQHMYIGTDNQTVRIHTGETDPKKLSETIRSLLLAGVSRKEILSGLYGIKSLSKHTVLITEAEKSLSNQRVSGIVSLIVNCTSSVSASSEDKNTNGDAFMITPTEQNAIDILHAMAKQSAKRAENGILFWESEFRRKIDRHSHKPLHEFVSAVAESIGTNLCSTELPTIIADLLETEEDKIMEEIRNKSYLLVALLYQQMRKDGNKNED